MIGALFAISNNHCPNNHIVVVDSRIEVRGQFFRPRLSIHLLSSRDHSRMSYTYVSTVCLEALPKQQGSLLPTI